MAKKGGRLLEFYGTECHVCIEMAPLIERLEKEEGIKIEKLECWHDDKNDALREKMDEGDCGGVPLFINEKAGHKHCGGMSYEELVAWAKEK
jgi:thiol-disulfide isomerase/thioredoxin